VSTRLSRLTLQHLADSSFPSGAFAHSWGLEWGVEAGWIYDKSSLAQWSRTLLEHTILPLEGALAVQAWQVAAPAIATENCCATQQLLELDRLLQSYRCSLTSREAAAQVGRSFLTSVVKAYPLFQAQQLAEAVRATASTSVIQFPIAWGAICGWLGISCEEMLDSLLLSTIKQWAQVAIRLIPLGIGEAQQFIAENIDFLIRHNVASKAMLSKGLPRSLAPALDIATLGHEHMAKRYFRS
jgi:urease accessory protein